MQPEVKAQFNDDILCEALSRYGIDRWSIKSLDGFESFVYSCEHDGLQRILRISHSGRRPKSQIDAEVEWIHYLFENRVGVCPAVLSLNGNYTETISCGPDEYFSAVVFEFAKGVPATPEFWTPPLFERMGRMLGRMHALSKGFVPSVPAAQRPHWDEEVEGIAEKFLPEDQSLIVEKCNGVLHQTRQLSKNRDTYGLVHIDFHRGNFHVDGDDIFLFDFDDSQYSWFADDIAIALFYAIPHDCTADADLEFARTFMTRFLTGYRTQNTIDPESLSQIPLFLKRRELDLYVVIHRSCDLSNLGEWGSSFMRGRREQIESDTAYVAIDFSVL